MAKQNSFDIVSEIDFAEVKNAINQATKEIIQRYDLKNSNSTVDFDEKADQGFPQAGHQSSPSRGPPLVGK